MNLFVPLLYSYFRQKKVPRSRVLKSDKCKRAKTYSFEISTIFDLLNFVTLIRHRRGAEVRENLIDRHASSEIQEPVRRQRNPPTASFRIYSMVSHSFIHSFKNRLCWSVLVSEVETTTDNDNM